MAPVPSNQNPYKFDFDAAVREARQDYPAETKNITFVDLSSPAAGRQIYEWYYFDYLKTHCHTLYPLRASFEETVGRSYPSLDHFDPVEAESFFSNIPRAIDSLKGMARIGTEKILESAGFCSGAHSSGDRSLVAMHTDLQKTHMLDDPDKNLYFIFSHELGHAIVPGGREVMGDPSFERFEFMPAPHVGTTNTHEVTADGFGLLRGLSKGILTLEDVSAVAQNRMWAATLGDISHFTSPQIQVLQLQAKDADIISLTPAQVRAVAQAHAAHYPAPAAGLAALEDECRAFVKSLLEDPEKSACLRLCRDGNEQSESVFKHMRTNGFFRTEVAHFFNDVCGRTPAGSYVHTAAQAIADMVQPARPKR